MYKCFTFQTELTMVPVQKAENKSVKNDKITKCIGQMWSIGYLPRGVLKHSSLGFTWFLMRRRIAHMSLGNMQVIVRKYVQLYVNVTEKRSTYKANNHKY